MSKAIFTTSEGSAYDDQPELRYHFPRTYLNQVRQSENDWIIYYEPRRTTGPHSATGRQAYFAIAFVDRVAEDPRRPDHFYAYVKHYLEMDSAVSFRAGAHYYETGLKKVDGSTNRGAFGRSVRLISEDDFAAIVTAGFTRELSAWEAMDIAVADIPERVDRPVVTQVISKKYRDEAFRRHVRGAYDNTCAITGLKLINGHGRPEVQAAHIRPVEEDGPDTVRNGLALTGTVHWLFDRGLISIDDNFKVLLSPAGLPDDLERLIPKHRTLTLPPRPELRPHPTYLGWHRDYRFKT